MMSQWHGGDAGDGRDAQTILVALLGQLDAALKEIHEIANGMPLFAVEAILVERLNAVLPGVRFTAHDIRAWVAEISS